MGKALRRERFRHPQDQRLQRDALDCGGGRLRAGRDACGVGECRARCGARSAARRSTFPRPSRARGARGHVQVGGWGPVRAGRCPSAPADGGVELARRRPPQDRRRRQPRKTLVGIHYFAGWYPGPFSHWNLGPLPQDELDAAVPGPDPAAGQLHDEPLHDRGRAPADANGVDFLSCGQILTKSAGAGGQVADGSELSPLTDTALAWMLNTTIWPSLKGGLHFMISYSTDFDSAAPRRRACSPVTRAISCLRATPRPGSGQWRPRYLKVDSRLSKIPGYNFWW